MNPFAQSSKLSGLDPRLDWRIRLPGEDGGEQHAKSKMEMDMRELREILSIGKVSTRRRALRKFLLHRCSASTDAPKSAVALPNRNIWINPPHSSRVPPSVPQRASQHPCCRQFIEPIALESSVVSRKRSRLFVVGWNRSSHMTSGGRSSSLGVMVITGDGINTVGLGYGQAKMAPKALERAYRRAQRNTVRVPKFMLHTIREPVEAKVGASIVRMWPALDQRGFRCNQYTKTMAELCGLRDIRSRVLRR